MESREPDPAGHHPGRRVQPDSLPGHVIPPALSPEERKKVGISDSLVSPFRGIEEVEEIIGDLEQALKKI